MSERPNIFDQTYDDLVIRMRELGQKAYRARQVMEWLYEKRKTGFGEMTNIPVKAQEQLAEYFIFKLPSVVEELTSEDGSRKFVLELSDGARIEAVLIPMDDRHTLCISSQVGCKFGCKFCRTGLMGFIRDLSPGEITGQLLAIERQTGLRCDNVVFMGMGEPLDNFENLLKAISISVHPEGLAMSPRRITISTAGIPDNMIALKRAHPRIGLSLSLNAPYPTLRSELMPIEETHTLEKLVSVLRKINPGRQDPVTIEYVLLDGVNDSSNDASALIRLFEGMDNVKVNLIPFNPSKDLPYGRPSRERVERFQSELRRKGFECFIRRSAGRDIHAACGQLATKDK
jgi:23S rRNA (adenine2503-C2)-methyltransferase